MTDVARTVAAARYTTKTTDYDHGGAEVRQNQVVDLDCAAGGASLMIGIDDRR
jgi:hypothetical protein